MVEISQDQKIKAYLKQRGLIHFVDTLPNHKTIAIGIILRRPYI